MVASKLISDLMFRPGVRLVDGTGPTSVPYTRHIKEVLPDEFGNGEPQKLFNQNGTVTSLMIKRIADDYAPAAAGFTLQLPTRSSGR
jgi:hypothetical protein